MTEEEYEAWQTRLASDYAAEQVRAGRWEEDGAEARARQLNETFLPQGLHTERMLIVLGLDELGEVVGRAWAGLDHPQGTPGTGFLYDIEIAQDRRGEGYGRELLRAVETALGAAGVTALELNVFGGNAAAVRLYDKAGFAVATQQMRKVLDHR